MWSKWSFSLREREQGGLHFYSKHFDKEHYVVMEPHCRADESEKFRRESRRHDLCSRQRKVNDCLMLTGS